MIDFFGYLLTSTLLVLIILFAAYFVNLPTYDYSKHSAYECGFEPFGDARDFFDVSFYTIGILFIIFDLEVVYLLPLVADVSDISAVGYVMILIFMAFVLVGFYYEWIIGLLNWLPVKSYTTKASK